jgi:hypothetical protein
MKTSADFKYWKTLGEAFKTIFKHYQIFYPTLIMMILSLIFMPLYAQLFVSFSWTYLFVFSIFYIVLLLAGLFSYAWILSLIKQIIKTKKVNLKKSLKEIFPLALKLFLVGLLLSVFMIAFYFALILLFVVGGLLSLIPIIGVIILVLLVLAFIVLMFAIFFALLHLLPIIAFEEKDPWETLKLVFNYFMENKLHSLKLGLISLLVLYIAYIPMLVFIFTVGATEIYYYIANNFVTYFVVIFLTGIPVIIAFIWVIMFYCLAYIKKK